MGIFAGRLSDLFGPKVLGIAIAILLGIGFLLMSQVTTIWQLYVIYGLLISIGIGSAWPVLLSTVSRWFIARRGLMTGIVASGIGIGTMAIPLLATWLITNHEWRLAYVIIGAITFLFILLASLLLT